MIGVDTNILVRYLTQDDQVQSAIVNDFIETILKNKKKLYVNLMVMCEIIWVLEDCYHYSKQEILEAVQMICNVQVIEIEGREVLLQALQDLSKQTADISDCLIGRFNQFAKCPYTVSFDKRACKLDTFLSVEKWLAH